MGNVMTSGFSGELHVDFIELFCGSGKLNMLDSLSSGSNVCIIASFMKFGIKMKITLFVSFQTTSSRLGTTLRP